MINSFSAFFSTIKPLFDMFMGFLNYPVFSVPLWRLIFSLFLFSFVIGFIVKGAVSPGGLVGTGTALASPGRSGTAASSTGAKKNLNFQKSTSVRSTYYDSLSDLSND